jgi:BASS family bile acid:Na+ symporter
MEPKQLVILALQVSVACTVLGFGLKATSQDLRYLIRRPSLLGRSLLSVLVVVPAIVIVGTSMLPLRHTVEVALIAWAISPLPPLLPGTERTAGERRSYAIALMAMLALLSIVFVPLAVELLARLYGRSLTVASGDIARIIMFSTMIPLLAGVAVRAWLPGIADRIVKPVEALAKVLLTLGALVLVGASWQAIWGAVGDGTVIALGLFVAAALLVGHLMGGPQPEHAVVLALSSAGRHPAIAFSVAAANFPDERFGGTILLYFIVSAIVRLPYLAWQRRRLKASIVPA